MKPYQTIAFLLLSFGSLPCYTAVHLSSDKTGSAIIVPFYTVSNQMHTMLSLNNTTDENKAVKIHFKESKTGDAVSSFNVYLAAKDMWTMVTGRSGPEEFPHMIMASNDESCTTGFPNDEPFTLDADWHWENGIIEIIEMGTIEQLDALDITDLDCQTIESYWETDQMWANNSEDKMSPAKGGLHAEVTLMDVYQGHSANVPVIHIGGFYGEDNIQHTAAGESTPNLSTGTKDSLVVTDGHIATTTWPTGYEAVSALLMHQNIINEFNTEDSVAAQSEFIVSLPTLHYHRTDSKKPFNYYSNNTYSFWFPTLYHDQVFYNREGDFGTHYPCSNCSPIPPELLNHSVSNFVVSRIPDHHNPGEPYVLPNPILSSVNASESIQNLDNTQFIFAHHDIYDSFEQWSFINGKIRFDLQSLNNDRGFDTHNPNIKHKYLGLPVVGFSFTRFTNANAQPGLLAQYAFVREHFGDKKVEIATE